MSWLFYAALTALSEAAKDLFSKKALKKLEPSIVTFYSFLFAIPVTIPRAFSEEIPTVDSVFYLSLFAAAFLHFVAYTAYVRAIKVSPLSLTLPMISFTPIFMLVTAPFMIGEMPSIYGMWGVVLIVLGTYLLNISVIKQGMLAPFKALFNEPGSRLMLIVAFVWSITGNIDRIGVRHSSLHFWLFCLMTTLAAFLFIPVALSKESRGYLFKREVMLVTLPAGILSGLSMYFYTEAIGLTLISYVVSVKRFSILLSIIGGYFFFGERRLRERLLGASIMVAGLVLIGVGR